jgi:NO-binding membrane sensor protein with MHYT domain
VAFAAAFITLRKTPHSMTRIEIGRLMLLVLTCVLFFAAMQLIWFAAERNGLLHVPR